MTNRSASLAPLLLLLVAMVVAGCDQPAGNATVTATPTAAVPSVRPT